MKTFYRIIIYISFFYLISSDYCHRFPLMDYRLTDDRKQKLIIQYKEINPDIEPVRPLTIELIALDFINPDQSLTNDFDKHYITQKIDKNPTQFKSLGVPLPHGSYRKKLISSLRILAKYCPYLAELMIYHSLMHDVFICFEKPAYIPFMDSINTLWFVKKDFNTGTRPEIPAYWFVGQISGLSLWFFVVLFARHRLFKYYTIHELLEEVDDNT